MNYILDNIQYYINNYIKQTYLTALILTFQIMPLDLINI